MSVRFSLLSLVTLVCFAPAGFAATDRTQGAYEIGAASYKAGQFDKARKYFESAAIKSPSDPNVHYGLGETYIALGKTAEGLEEYEKTIKLAPKTKLARYALAGEQYASQAAERQTLAKMAKLAQGTTLPAPSQPKYFAPEALPQPTVIRSSGGYGSSTTISSGLPQPSLPTYGPQPQQQSYSRIRHGRRSGWGNGGGYYTPSSGYYSHTPQLEVQSYGIAPPLNIVAKQDPPPPVELLARQERLVIDDKTKH